MLLLKLPNSQIFLASALRAGGHPPPATSPLLWPNPGAGVLSPPTSQPLPTPLLLLLLAKNDPFSPFHSVSPVHPFSLWMSKSCTSLHFFIITNSCYGIKAIFNKDTHVVWVFDLRCSFGWSPVHVISTIFLSGRVHAFSPLGTQWI